MSNGAAFGTDYLTRTAIAKSNIGVNSPNETRYFYQDFDASGERLNGANHYTIIFPKASTFLAILRRLIAGGYPSDKTH